VKLQARAAKVGFDWPSTDEVYDKIAEEIAELRDAAAEERPGELGDLLFALANLARHWGSMPKLRSEPPTRSFRTTVSPYRR